MEKVIATYHKDCIDGTTAAAVVLRKFPTAKLFPLTHAHRKEDIEPVLGLVDAETVCYTVDCGLGVKEFLAAGCKVTTLDHHSGAKDLFESITRENENYTFIFDNEKSAASLAWSFFFPEEKQPELIRYVEDADLWKWKFGDDTKDVNNYLSMFRNDPKTMLGFIEGDLSEIKSKGKVISMYADKEIEVQITLPPIDIKIGEHTVPAYNVTVYQSASGNILSDRLNKAVAKFTVEGDTVNFSFRSKDHHKPTSLELAHFLGGGGHQNAAGADIALKEFLKMIVS
jgi:oligoribonuclease NrnB/cAMP/cGMP phosphodiesterase (DHH superfamily)